MVGKTLELDGRILKGVSHITKGRVLVFNPKHAHTALPYQGERWTITGYSMSGVEKLSLLDRNVLARVKFPFQASSTKCRKPAHIS